MTALVIIGQCIVIRWVLEKASAWCGFGALCSHSISRIGAIVTWRPLPRHDRTVSAS
jgi:hypothetical protein